MDFSREFLGDGISVSGNHQNIAGKF